jgi:hypothetical protein
VFVEGFSHFFCLKVNDLHVTVFHCFLLWQIKGEENDCNVVFAFDRLFFSLRRLLLHHVIVLVFLRVVGSGGGRKNRSHAVLII